MVDIAIMACLPSSHYFGIKSTLTRHLSYILPKQKTYSQVIHFLEKAPLGHFIWHNWQQLKSNINDSFTMNSIFASVKSVFVFERNQWYVAATYHNNKLRAKSNWLELK